MTTHATQNRRGNPQIDLTPLPGGIRSAGDGMQILRGTRKTNEGETKSFAPSPPPPRVIRILGNCFFPPFFYMNLYIYIERERAGASARLFFFFHVLRPTHFFPLSTWSRESRWEDRFFRDEYRKRDFRSVKAIVVIFSREPFDRIACREHNIIQNAPTHPVPVYISPSPPLPAAPEHPKPPLTLPVREIHKRERKLEMFFVRTTDVYKNFHSLDRTIICVYDSDGQ